MLRPRLLRFCTLQALQQARFQGLTEALGQLVLRPWASLGEFLGGPSWRLPEIELPPFIIHLSGIFQYKPSIWGSPHLQKPPIGSFNDHGIQGSLRTGSKQHHSWDLWLIILIHPHTKNGWMDSKSRCMFDQWKSWAFYGALTQQQRAVMRQESVLEESC